MKRIGKAYICILIVFILLVSTNISLAVTQSELEAQKNQQVQEQQNKQKQTQSQIDEVTEQKEQVEAEKSETMKEVEKISSQISQYEAQIDDLDNQIVEANQKIADATSQLKQAQQNYDKQQKTLEDRMVALYEAGETSYLDVLLTSQSVTDFISNYYLISEVAECDLDLLNQIDAQKKKIESVKTELETNKQNLVTVKATKEQVSTQLKSSKAEKNSYVNKLSEDEKQLQQKLDELQEANRSINQKIKAAEAQYQKQLEELKRMEEEAKKNSSSGSSGSSGSSSSGGSTWTSGGSGYLQRPVKTGSITATMYYSSGSYHGALDYGVSVGMPVYAAADGVVMTTANLSGSYGTHVVIRHANGLQTYYAHGASGSICVSPGQIVKKGQQIMRSGNTGNSSGPHLHFEVRKAPYSWSSSGNDDRVDPRNYM